jgi:DNA-binding transcriptional LysR family regulator
MLLDFHGRFGAPGSSSVTAEGNMLEFRLSQLRSFLVLAETLNYARAARTLYMAQPTLSGQIKSLEEAFGVQLFERTRQHVHLTEAGSKLAVSSRRILQDLERLQTDMSAVELQTPVRVCSSQSGQYELVPQLLRQLAERPQPLRLEFHSLVPEDRLEALLKRKVDALLMVPPSAEEGILYRGIVEERLIAALPAREPFLSMESISIEAFAHETLLLPAAHQCAWCQKNNLAILAKFGLRPPTVEAPIDLNSRMAMIAGGRFVGFVGDSAWNSSFPGVLLLPFKEQVHTQQLGIAWRADDASRGMLDLLASVASVQLPYKRLERPPVSSGGMMSRPRRKTVLQYRKSSAA